MKEVTNLQHDQPFRRIVFANRAHPADPSSLLPIVGQADGKILLKTPTAFDSSVTILGAPVPRQATLPEFLRLHLQARLQDNFLLQGTDSPTRQTRILARQDTAQHDIAWQRQSTR